MLSLLLRVREQAWGEEHIGELLGCCGYSNETGVLH